ncbi:Mut7-C ubiquitin/RNAse domain-containing protein [Chitinophagaceae bacterium LB-8]|uniref:Mut7-C ubiquitin/RNAse domain-containing protein n=1 Tax=Paraflavisolibacter caeni TaxID=2982496 RepID=A0A9X2XVA0_9BACT|nr:Mut7-C RNAse domain-containing protein [Paraflavisolibacter caeni]MCU7549032.1 Mut7-C ubiquitin/RNAse domain-containing protein [Paraflavisolibacter caeni]
MTTFFYFHKSLNDFLSVSKRNSWISYTFHGISSVKDAIEALGIPHPEVDIILVHNLSVDFTYRLKENDHIDVYPILPDHVFPENYSLSKKYIGLDQFVLDVHLGKLGKAMRVLGIDSLMENNFSDQKIAQIAASENRIVLTRDVGLLKHKVIKCGYWIRSQYWEEQLSEVVERFNLRNKMKPFTRCTVCNGIIEPVSKDVVIDQLPLVSKQLFTEFFQCTNCKRVYWKGSHYEHMEEWVKRWTTNRNE